MSVKRSVILRGDPEINEDGVASATVKPGYLVKGVSVIAHQTATTGSCPKALALEREELGAGIDDANRGASTISAFYASGDTVKVGVFDSGDRATGFIASGQNISEDDLLECNGDGTFKEGSTKPIARSLDTLGVIAAVTACRVEFL